MIKTGVITCCLLSPCALGSCLLNESLQDGCCMILWLHTNFEICRLLLLSSLLLRCTATAGCSHTCRWDLLQLGQ